MFNPLHTLDRVYLHCLNAGYIPLDDARQSSNLCLAIIIQRYNMVWTPEYYADMMHKRLLKESLEE